MNFLNNKLIISVIAIMLGTIIYLVINNFLTRVAKKRSHTKKGKTYIKLLGNISKYIILIIVILFILQVNGINISSIIAGLGVVSVVAGLSLQDALKDIIAGFNIIVDEYFAIGDVLDVDGVVGKVYELGLKSTKLKDIYNQNILVIANRNIVKALLVSNQLDIDIPVGYGEKLEKVEKVIGDIVNDVKKVENVLKVDYKGVNEFADSAIMYKIRMDVKPEYQPETKRRVNRIIKLEFDKNGIEIPFMQIDIHNKN